MTDIYKKFLILEQEYAVYQMYNITIARYSNIVISCFIIIKSFKISIY